jgi:aspartyl-tRNA(Asn)/glutamyl-tRNA(Gln) amidotransferase subunit B
MMGNRCEIKNLNSIQGLAIALDYEIKRQTELLNRGFHVEKETRGFSEASRMTYTLRKKEDTDDYRYMPDPDLPPVLLSTEFVEYIRKRLPDVSDRRVTNLAQRFGLSTDDVRILLNDTSMLNYYEHVVAQQCDPKKAFNWYEITSIYVTFLVFHSLSISEPRITMELVGQLNKHQLDFQKNPVSFHQMVGLIRAVSSGQLSGKMGKDFIEYVIISGDSRDLNAIVEEKGWQLASSLEQLRDWCDKVLKDHPQKVSSR